MQLSNYLNLHCFLVAHPAVSFELCCKADFCVMRKGKFPLFTQNNTEQSSIINGYHRTTGQSLSFSFSLSLFSFAFCIFPVARCYQCSYCQGWKSRGAHETPDNEYMRLPQWTSRVVYVSDGWRSVIRPLETTFFPSCIFTCFVCRCFGPKY